MAPPLWMALPRHGRLGERAENEDRAPEGLPSFALNRPGLSVPIKHAFVPALFGHGSFVLFGWFDDHPISARGLGPVQGLVRPIEDGMRQLTGF